MAKARKPIERYRISVDVNADLGRRFAAYAGFHKLTQSSIVESALLQVLKGFVVSQRTDSPTSNESEDRQTLPIARVG